MRTQKLVQHFLNLDKLEAFFLMHNLESKNDWEEKGLYIGVLENKMLEHVIVRDLEA